MTRHALLYPSRIAVAAAMFTSLPAFALHNKNAGPDKVEIKFNLPPPAPLSPEQALATFKLEEGFRIELVAAEPMIEAPIAMSFDDQGRLYVVEMRAYMRAVDGSTDQQPLGRIKLLEDTDGDGRMDKASTFLDNLIMPRSVMAVNGGALVAVPPNLLFCKDTDGDGKADVKDIVATDYGSQTGQPEHMANTPTWMLDNAIWSAGYGTRFKLRSGVWQRDSGLGRGQYGLCQDDYGRPFYNYNSDMLRCDLLPAEAFSRNPLLRTATSVNASVVKDQTVWPSHPTPGVNRGYDAKTLRADGTLAKATGSCGAVIYRGDAFASQYRGNAFVPEPCGNLVKRFVRHEKEGVITAAGAMKAQDFLTSTDERFRPVQAANGPDGALYLADMYRGIIQHSGFLTHYLIANIAARKLEQPFEQGRIWRIVPTKPSKPLATTRVPADTAARVALLSHANGWVRDTAQRLIVESDKGDAAPALADLLRNAEASPLARLHALWTLDGLLALTPPLTRIALHDADAQLRVAAVRLATRDLAAELIAMATEKNALVSAHLAIKLSALNLPDADVALAKLLAAGGGKNSLIREGALTGLRGREVTFAKVLEEQTTKTNFANTAPVFEVLGSLVAMANKAQLFEEMLVLAAAQSKTSAVQLALLKGLATSPNSKGKNPTPPKLLWLESEPATLALLKQNMVENTAVKLMASVAARLAWPNKPGAPPPPKIVPLTEAQSVLYEQGKNIYGMLCAACHQPHGYGLDGLAPPLVDSEWVLGKPDILARIVMHGLAGPVKVSGRTYNLVMPPLPQLTDENIAGVLTYIRREWEHNASPVEVKTIADLRAKNKDRVMMWTVDELKKK